MRSTNTSRWRLAHTADNGLSGLLIEGDGEGGVLLGELLDGHTQLLLVALGLGLDGHVDDRVREGHGLQDDRGALGAQGVAGGDVLEADERVDVAGMGLLDRILLLECIWKSLPMRSFLPLVALRTISPCATLPE